MQETIEGLQEIRDLAAHFAAERLRPHVEHWDRAREIDSAITAQLAELGFHGLLVPEAHGGLGFGPAHFATVLEQIAWGEPVAAFQLLCSAAVAAALSSAEGDAQQWLSALAGGARTGASQLSRGDSLKAVQANGGWRLSGAAGWLLRDGSQQIALLSAMHGAERMLFALPAESEGLRVKARADTIGLRAAQLVTIEANELRLEEPACIVRGEALGRIETLEQLGTAAIALGIARAALEHARDYANIREQFHRKLRAFEGIQAKLADMDVRVAASRGLIVEAGQDLTPVTAARAKLYASETAMWVTTQAVQIFGGYGYMRDYPVEKLMRDAKTTEILTGVNEALRTRIAAGLYAD